MSDTDTPFRNKRPSELVTANAEDHAMPRTTDTYVSGSLCERSSTQTVGSDRSHSVITSFSDVESPSKSMSHSPRFASSYGSGRSDSDHSLSRSPSSAEGPSRLKLCNAVLNAVLAATGADRGTIDPDVPVTVASGTFDGPDRRIELVFRVRVPASSILGLLKQNARVVKRLLLLNGKRS